MPGDKIKQRDLFLKGGELRDEGINRAIAHAEKIQANWLAMANTALSRYIAVFPGEEFTAEDVREWAVWVPDPPDRRTWGGVFMSASKAGKIRSVGYRKHRDPIRHRGISTVWVANGQ